MTENLPSFDEWYRGDSKRLFEILSIFLNLAPGYVTREAVGEMTAGTSGNETFAVANLAAAACGIDAWNSPRDRAFFRDLFLPCFRRLDPAPFLNDPFTKEIVFPAAERGRWTLGMKKCAAYECFVADDPRVEKTPVGYRVIPQIGFFSEDYAYPAVCENGREWMTLMPNEIVTTRPAVEASRGDVLTFGLGLGYFAFSAARKPEVDSVTVCELSAEVISLFQEFILPQFPEKEKITIVNADAFDFAAEGMTRFDTVFCDIWHDPSDGVPLYLRMKEYEAKNPGPDYHYWLEKTLQLYV